MVEHPDHGAAGFQRVLDAEAAAERRVAGGRQEAEAIRRAALAEARGIAARADRRLQALHAGIQADIARQKARMARAFEAEKGGLSAPPEPDLVRAAARRLARRLVGIDTS